MLWLRRGAANEIAQLQGPTRWHDRGGPKHARYGQARRDSGEKVVPNYPVPDLNNKSSQLVIPK